MIDDDGNKEIVESLKRAQRIALARRIAGFICQHNRIIRSMPSAEEIERALPLARSIIAEVHADFKPRIDAIEKSQLKQKKIVAEARQMISDMRKIIDETRK